MVEEKKDVESQITVDSTTKYCGGYLKKIKHWSDCN